MVGRGRKKKLSTFTLLPGIFWDGVKVFKFPNVCSRMKMGRALRSGDISSDISWPLRSVPGSEKNFISFALSAPATRSESTLPISFYLGGPLSLLSALSGGGGAK